MSDVRCRACSASVPAGAQWCSLCFADLRTPAPVREPVSVPAAPAQAAVEVAPAIVAPLATAHVAPTASTSVPTQQLSSRPDPLTDPLVPVEAAAAPATADPSVDEAPEKTWPCPRCGSDVPLSLDNCEACGAGFLAGATTTTSTKLPVFGDVRRMSQAQRLLVGVGISVVLMALFLLVFTVGGKLL